MPLLILLSVCLLAAALAWWWPRYRLRRALLLPFPQHYSRILRKNLPAFHRMPADLQLQLKQRVRQFLHEKKFIGCDGFVITDEVRVTIAGHACMMLLNRGLKVFPDLQQILVYPSAFLVPRVRHGMGGVVTHSSQTLAGESWGDGRVILAWDHVVARNPEHRPGQNVVLHEFAHQLDSEGGYNNGAPLLPGRASYQRWSAVMQKEYDRLQHAAYMGQESVLDYYGATEPAEFFAVATETFFELPWELAQQHAELFELLRDYYRVDPREWRAALSLAN
jgi:Mlc titration factor MtfA (ptsG expression regulator)